MTAPMGNNGAKRYSYCYDREGRQVGMNVDVVSVTSSPTLTTGASDDNTRFFYDNSKNRVKLITKSGSAYYFVYDPTASIPAVVYEAAGATTYLNVREPNGSLISREKYEDGDLVYTRTYHFDGLGSAIALTDEDGVTTDTYSYDAWGNATHTSGTIADNPYQYVGELGYYTHWQEPTLNLLQLGVRYYDPTTGRFTQQDPIKDGLNWYGYAGGNPIRYVDPFGLSSICQSSVSLKPELYARYGAHQKITAKVCRDTCEEGGFNPALCRALCSLLKNITCVGLKGLAKHLIRHPEGRHMAGACDFVYSQLCE